MNQGFLWFGLGVAALASFMAMLISLAMMRKMGSAIEQYYARIEPELQAALAAREAYMAEVRAKCRRAMQLQATVHSQCRWE